MTDDEFQYGPPPMPTIVRYERRGDFARSSVQNLSDAELIDLAVGLARRLALDERLRLAGMIADPLTELSPIARAMHDPHPKNPLVRVVPLPEKPGESS